MKGSIVLIWLVRPDVGIGSLSIYGHVIFFQGGIPGHLLSCWTSSERASPDALPQCAL